MRRCPIFHKEQGKIRQQDFIRTIWCPHYDDCLSEAAAIGCLMDCSECENSTINFKNTWRNRYIDYCLRRNCQSMEEAALYSIDLPFPGV